jgi:hypothetical protein
MTAGCVTSIVPLGSATRGVIFVEYTLPVTMNNIQGG